MKLQVHPYKGNWLNWRAQFSHNSTYNYFIKHDIVKVIYDDISLSYKPYVKWQKENFILYLVF